MSVILVRRDTGAGLTFDGAEVRLVSSANVSEHPVETGAPVSDHSQREARSAAIQGRITESPFAPADTSGPERITAALAFLDGVLDDGAPLDVYLGERLGFLSPALLVRFEAPITARRGVTIPLLVREVRFAVAESVRVVRPVPAVEPGAGEEKDQGEAGVGDSAPRSWLRSLADAVGAFE